MSLLHIDDASRIAFTALQPDQKAVSAVTVLRAAAATGIRYDRAGRCLRQQAVIMDEPTAALGVQKTAQVESTIRVFKAGVRLILVSSSLRQAFDPIDSILVFRRGRIAGAVDRDKTTGYEVVSMITGVADTPGEAAFA